ncbi:hypothetical protein MKX01_005374, partial [Papaver californicum]
YLEVGRLQRLLIMRQLRNLNRCLESFISGCPYGKWIIECSSSKDGIRVTFNYGKHP